MAGIPRNENVYISFALEDFELIHRAVATYTRAGFSSINPTLEGDKYRTLTRRLEAVLNSIEFGKEQRDRERLVQALRWFPDSNVPLYSEDRAEEIVNELYAYAEGEDLDLEVDTLLTVFQMVFKPTISNVAKGGYDPLSRAELITALEAKNKFGLGWSYDLASRMADIVIKSGYPDNIDLVKLVRDLYDAHFTTSFGYD